MHAKPIPGCCPLAKHCLKVPQPMPNNTNNTNNADANDADDELETENDSTGLENDKKTKSKRQLTSIRDQKNYVPNEAKNRHTENGLAINSFRRQAMNAEFSVVDLVSNDETRQPVKPGAKRWDRLKKKMVPVQDHRAGKIRTESGAWIASSFKTGRYNEWKEKSKIEEQLHKEQQDENDDAVEAKRMKFSQSHGERYPVGRYARHNAKVAAKKNAIIPGNRKYTNELRNPDQIVRSRMRLQLIKQRNAVNTLRKAENRKRSMRTYRNSIVIYPKK